MARPGGINGVALGIGLAGTVLLWSGLRGASIADTLRAAIKGDINALGAGSKLGSVAGSAVQTGATASGGGAGTAMGGQVAADALHYLGVPYKWAGETPDGWDCSGFVTYVLHHDFGLNLPDNVHTTAARFLTWGGARSIPRSQCAAGDLVCWASHIGIAVNNKQMVNAPTFTKPTEVDTIWSLPAPVIRRPLAYG